MAEMNAYRPLGAVARIDANEVIELSKNDAYGVLISENWRTLKLMPTIRRVDDPTKLIARVIGDTTSIPIDKEKKIHYAHRAGLYSKVIENPEVDLMLSNLAAVEKEYEVRQFIRKAMPEFDVSLFMGGEDISGDVTGDYELEKTSHEYGINRLRDAANKLLWEEAEKKTFVLGICRGEQLGMVLMGSTISLVDTLHYPPTKDDPPLVHSVTRYYPEGEEPTDLGLEDLREVNSHHHLGFRLKDVDQEKLKEHGWSIYYVYAENGQVDGESIVEVVVRRNERGVITGIMTQGHPERFDTAEGQKMQNWIRKCIAEYLVDKQLHPEDYESGAGHFAQTP